MGRSSENVAAYGDHVKDEGKQRRNRDTPWLLFPILVTLIFDVDSVLEETLLRQESPSILAKIG